MSNITAKVPADNAMPSCAVLFVKLVLNPFTVTTNLLFYICSNILPLPRIRECGNLFNGMFLQSNSR